MSDSTSDPLHSTHVRPQRLRAASPELKQQQAMLAILPEDARRAFRYAMLLDRARNGEAMFLLPFDLKIK